MLKARIAVLVSGGGTNLQALIEAEKKGTLKSGEIKLVVSNKKDAFALLRAKKAGIRNIYISDDGEGFEEKLLKELKASETDLLILAGFLRVLGGDFIKRFGKPIINIHPSLIPSFCGKGFYGLRVHEAVIKRGVKITGATVHFVNEIPDGGEIISQKAVCVLPGDDAKSLQKRVMEEAEWVMLSEAAEKICEKIGKGKL